MKRDDELPEFGTKRENEERRDGGCGIVFDPNTQKYAVGLQKSGRLRLFSGGVDEDEGIEKGVLREVREESGLYEFEYVELIAEVMAHFHNTLKKVNRVARASCFLVILKSTKLQDVQLEAHEVFELTWVSAQELLANWEEGNEEHNFDHWVYFLKKAVARAVELGYDTTTQSKLYS